MFKRKVSKNFQSEADQFFHDFDTKRHSFPKSRQNEIAKHQKLFQIRDGKQEDSQNIIIWQEF